LNGGKFENYFFRPLEQSRRVNFCIRNGPGNKLKVCVGGGGHRSSAKVGGTDRSRSSSPENFFFGRAPPLFWL